MLNERGHESLGSFAINPATSTTANSTHALLSALDEFDALDFRKAERLIKAIKREARNVSGYPLIRPDDCDRAIETLGQIIKSNEAHIALRDNAVAERLDELFSALSQTDVRFYAAHLFKLKMLQASLRLAYGNMSGAVEIIERYSSREYLFEGDWLARLEFAILDGNLRLTRSDTTTSFVSLRRAAKTAYIERSKSVYIFERLAGLIALGHPRAFTFSSASLFVWLASRVHLWASKGAGTYVSNLRFSIIAKAAAYLGGFGLRWVEPSLLRKSDSRKRVSSKPSNVLVTRAMGGIGDLLMMTPGLRALSKRCGGPVTVAVPSRYFPVFEGNEHINLMDIEGTPPIDVDEFEHWYDLTVCPAGRYESSARPNVSVGRVELFARGLGVSKRDLNKHGWHLEAHLNTHQRTFAEDFIRKHCTARRPILGIQPFSRDTYKDLPECRELVRILKRKYDVILFHHQPITPLNSEHVISTVGLSLSQSLALVPRLQAMVCVDSAMLHAAAAFDVPTVALFGPTPGQLFTKHHERVKVIQSSGPFVCRPCWRNEDMKCLVTGTTGYSACMRAFDPGEIVSAVQEISRQSAVVDALARRHIAPSFTQSPIKLS